MATKYPGLLVSEDDKHQAMYRGLLDAGAAMSGGWSDKPVSFLGQFAKGGQALGKGYQGGITQTKQDQFANMQAQSQQAQMEAQKMKIEQAKRDELARKQAETWRQMGGMDMAGNKVPMPLTSGQHDYQWQQQNQVFQPRATSHSGASKYASDLGHIAGTPEHRAAMENYQANQGTTVNLGGELETEEQKYEGRRLVEAYGEVGAGANSARTTMAYNGLARSLVSQPENVPTAWGQIAGNIAVNMGLPISDATRDSISTGQMFQGTIGNLLAAKLNAATGPQTDKDADRLLQTLASLGNTPEAKTFLLDASDAMSRRDIAKESFFDQWKASHNNSTAGAKSAWNKKVGNIPMFGVNPADNRPVFFDTFMEDLKRANPNATDEEITALWVKKYGK
jgi:hypothetical protein